MTAATLITDLLGLGRQPVAIQFCDSAPESLDRVPSAAPSGCTYWKLAADGQTFYTEAADHFGCPVGAHTHGVDLPPDEAQQLEELVGTMVELEYLDMSEVADIPRRDAPFGVVIYAPASNVDFAPDVILVSGSAKQLMLLAEAAHSAGLACDTSMVGRPTCAAIPAVMQSGKCATNLGCIGNRVYTEMSDDELYFALPGQHLERLVEKLKTIIKANLELERFHRARAI